MNIRLLVLSAVAVERAVALSIPRRGRVVARAATSHAATPAARASSGVEGVGFEPEAQDLLASSYRHLHVVDGVIESTDDARAVFDERFSRPREAHTPRDDMVHKDWPP